MINLLKKLGSLFALVFIVAIISQERGQKRSGDNLESQAKKPNLSNLATPANAQAENSSNISQKNEAVLGLLPPQITPALFSGHLSEFTDIRSIIFPLILQPIKEINYYSTYTISDDLKWLIITEPDNKTIIYQFPSADRSVPFYSGIVRFTTPDSKLFVSYNLNQNIFEIYDIEEKFNNPQALPKLSINTSIVMFSPDCKWLATKNNFANEASIYNLEEKLKDKNKNPSFSIPVSGNIYFSPDSKIIAVRNHNNIEVYDIEKKLVNPQIGSVLSIPVEENESEEVTFSPNSKILVVTQNDNFKAYNIDAKLANDNALPLFTLKVEYGNFDFSPDSKMILISALDNSKQELYSIDELSLNPQAEPILSESDYSSMVNPFSPNSKFLALIGGWGNYYNIFNLEEKLANLHAEPLAHAKKYMQTDARYNVTDNAQGYSKDSSLFAESDHIEEPEKDEEEYSTNIYDINKRLNLIEINSLANQIYFKDDNSFVIVSVAGKKTLNIYDLNFLQNPQIKRLIEGKVTPKQYAFLTLLDDWSKKPETIENNGKVSLKNMACANALTLNELLNILYSFPEIVVRSLIQKYKIMDVRSRFSSSSSKMEE